MHTASGIADWNEYIVSMVELSQKLDDILVIVYHPIIDVRPFVSLIFFKKSV